MADSILHRARVALAISQQLRDHCARRAYKQSALGVSKNTATHLLSGRHDYRLSSLVHAAEALECELVIELKPKMLGQ